MRIIDIHTKRDLDGILKNNKHVLGMFCSSWCPFCQDFQPVFKAEIENYSYERIVRVFLEEDNNPLWEDFSIEAVPTVIFFDNSQISSRLDSRLGEGLNRKQFREWLAKLKT